MLPPQTKPIDAIPPHSAESEAAIIGAILSEPLCMKEAQRLQSTHFYDPLHEKLFRLIQEHHQAGTPLTFASLQYEVDKAKIRLEQNTRWALMEAASPSTIGTDCGRIIEAYQRRESIKAASMLMQAAQNGTFDAVIPKIQDHLTQIKSVERRAEYVLEDLLTYNTENDSECLLGNRFLCIGGACVWVGGSGLGKSSLTMQAIIRFACGEDLFGMLPQRKLSSLVIQAENDQGDLAEQCKGVLNGLKLSHDQLEDVKQRLCIIHEDRRTGPEFCSWLDAVIDHHKPDLVWIDPLFSYIGGDMNDQKVVSPFLRNHLGPLARKHQCALMVIHHTGKPKDAKTFKSMQSGDFAYMGMGSSELTNWARAVITLREIDDNRYELRAAKRGPRANFTIGDNQSSQYVVIQHGTEGIYWEPAPDQAESMPELDDATLAGLLTKEWINKSDLIQAIRKELGVCRNDASYMLNRIIERHKMDDLNIEDGAQDFGSFQVLRQGGGFKFRAL